MPLTSKCDSEKLEILFERQRLVLAVQYHPDAFAHLVLGCIVQQRVRALCVSIMQ